MLGTVGWRASLLFVRRIYQVIVWLCVWRGAWLVLGGGAR
jgi:hypothetical protein